MTEARKRILIVDDSPLLLDLAKEALEHSGFAVVVAQDFSQLAGLQDHPSIDLILIDVQMPDLYGDDVAAVLREVRGVKTPIYLLSSLAADELAARAREAELEGYLCKRDGIDALVTRHADLERPMSSKRVGRLARPRRLLPDIAMIHR